jgi:hypothetical protein
MSGQLDSRDQDEHPRTLISASFGRGSPRVVAADDLAASPFEPMLSDLSRVAGDKTVKWCRGWVLNPMPPLKGREPDRLASTLVLSRLVDLNAIGTACDNPLEYQSNAFLEYPQVPAHELVI